VNKQKAFYRKDRLIRILLYQELLEREGASDSVVLFVCHTELGQGLVFPGGEDMTIF